jgi:hypothetical protein
MSKGENRPGKEPRKQKTTEKKPTGPKYLRGSELTSSVKLGAQKPPQKS